VAGNAGAALSEFCTGNANKLSYQGQTFSAPVTSFESAMPLNCCMTYGVALHSLPQLGFDLQLTVIEFGGQGSAAGDYLVNGTTMAPFRVSIAKLGDNSAMFSNLMTGTLRLVGAVGKSPWALGFCLQVNGVASSFADARVYVPQVTMTTYADHKRLQIFRLADSNITPTQAASSALATLTLASTPWLDLSGIVSVERPSGIVEIATVNTGVDALRSSLSDVPLSGAPFVVMVDDVPIYLGTFWRSISSMMPVGPTITIEDITSSQLTISPASSGSDPRFEARIVQVLTETGRLLP
jgi:hypothetical protein